MYRILLVDDDPNILSTLTRVLTSIPIADLDGERPQIESFLSASEALVRADAVAFDLVISDFRMPEMSGVDFLSRLIQHQPNVVRIFLTGGVDREAMADAVRKVQPYCCMDKPWRNAQLKSAVTQSLRARAHLKKDGAPVQNREPG